MKNVLQRGELNPDDYLTARFDIDAVMLTSEVKRNGEVVNPYAESLDIDRPLVFEKDGETVHRLRSVETYMLNADGERIEDEAIRFRTANTWQLRQDGPGVAELSVYLADVADAPEGDLVIDPSMLYPSQNFVDALLDYNSYTDYSSDGSVT